MRAMNVCNGCDRYVYASEAVCPFCGAADLHTVPPPPVGRSVSRAAGFAARAAFVVGAMGCAATHPSNPDGSAEDASTQADAASVADAGSSGTDAGRRDAGAAANDAAVADAATPDDAGGDAGDEVPVPIYGGVFPDPRERAIV